MLCAYADAANLYIDALARPDRDLPGGLPARTPSSATIEVGVVLIQIQVRLDEELLSGAHGRDYAEYRRDVRR